MIIILPMIYSGKGLTQTIIPADSIFDFGYTPRQSEVSHTFFIKSPPNDSLRVNNIIPGCGCITAAIDKYNLGPNDSTGITVELSTRNFSGRISKRPIIEIEGAPARALFRVRANVVSDQDSTYPVIIDPLKIEIKRVSGDKISDFEFSFKNISDEELRLQLIKAPRDMIKLKYPKKIKAGQTKTGKIKLEDKYRDIEFKESVTFQLNDQSETRFTIPINHIIENSPNAE
jgi:hypothetical protein